MRRGPGSDSSIQVPHAPALHTHLALSTAAEIQEFTSCFLVGASLLLDHCPDIRLAHARHLVHVSFHLVANLRLRFVVAGDSDRQSCDSEYHSVTYSTSDTSLELGETYYLAR
jgi:hypothetical protein